MQKETNSLCALGIIFLHAYAADMEGLGLGRSLLLTLCVHIPDFPVELGWLENVEYMQDILYMFSKLFVAK